MNLIIKNSICNFQEQENNLKKSQAKLIELMENKLNEEEMAIVYKFFLDNKFDKKENKFDETELLNCFEKTPSVLDFGKLKLNFEILKLKLIIKN